MKFQNNCIGIESIIMESGYESDSKEIDNAPVINDSNKTEDEDWTFFPNVIS